MTERSTLGGVGFAAEAGSGVSGRLRRGRPGPRASIGDGGSEPRAQASAMAVQWRRGRPKAEVLGGGGGTDEGKRVVDAR